VRRRAASKMPGADETSWLFEQQKMADERVDKVARSYCGAGEDGWCNNIVHEDQLKRYPPGMLCFARSCRFMLMFFITFCVIGLLMGWAFEGTMTVLEEIDTKTELNVPSLAVCPQPWGSTFAQKVTVKEAAIISIPGGHPGPPVKFKAVACPSGSVKEDSYWGGVEGYEEGLEGGVEGLEGGVGGMEKGFENYTGIQKLRAHSSQSESKAKQALVTHNTSSSRSGSSAPASQTGAGDLAGSSKPPLARKSWGTGHAGEALSLEEKDADRRARSLKRVALAFSSKRLGKAAEGVSSASLLQTEAVKRSGSDSHVGSLLGACFCVNLEENVLKFRGERGNIQDLDYVRLSMSNIENSNPLNKQFAFGFYTGGLLPQQWSYGDAGQTLEGDLRSEEVATGKTEFSDGTSVARFAFRPSGATQSADMTTTTIVFGYDKYLSYVMASFASKYSFFAMMTLIITCCAAVNNFGLFEIVFPERSDDGPPELEPNVALRSLLGYCCYCCTLTKEAQEKEDEEP